MPLYKLQNMKRLDMDVYGCSPIGFFHSLEQERYSVSRQSGVVKGNQGIIRLNSGLNFEQALEDLEGFDRIWVIYRFHRNRTWKPKVQPPRETGKKGLFATRSPHRPNFLGLSCVELSEIRGLDLLIKNHDLLDGTPIFDIKPYLVYADAFPQAKQGWLQDLSGEKQFMIEMSSLSGEQFSYLKTHSSVDIFTNIAPRLVVNPFPNSKNRIKKMGASLFEIAYKTWRVSYEVKGTCVFLQKVYSGYDADTLAGHRTSKWDDVPIHVDFVAKWP